MPPSSASKRWPLRHSRGVYLQDGGRHVGQLEEVRFTDIEHLEFDL
ncbi:hypothetical protein RKD18_007882 [Streptomyces phaeoluteigriseus]